MIRFLDVMLSLAGLVLAAPVMGLLTLVCAAETGSPIFAQTRLGKDRRPFTLYKFRTMGVGTASVATHLADRNAVTRSGRLLRATKLDELPQLFNVLRGDMSLVGPRPGLANQTALTAARQSRGAFAVRPGITGLAQIRGVDMSTPELLADLDAAMIASLGLRLYLRLLVQTLLGRGRGDAIAKAAPRRNVHQSVETSASASAPVRGERRR